MFGLRFGKPIKQPPIEVETEPEIRSIVLNGERYLNYEDVINFMMDKIPDEVRWELDRKTFSRRN